MLEKKIASTKLTHITNKVETIFDIICFYTSQYIINMIHNSLQVFVQQPPVRAWLMCRYCSDHRVYTYTRDNYIVEGGLKSGTINICYSEMHAN